MIKIRLSLLGVLLLWWVVPAFAGDSYFFDAGDSIALTVYNDYVVAKPDDEAFTTWTAIISGNQALSADFQPVEVADGFTLLAVNSGFSAATAVADLRQTNGILFANNVYVDPAGEGNIYPTDQLYLHFKTSTTQTAIDSLTEAGSPPAAPAEGGAFLYSSTAAHQRSTISGSPYHGRPKMESCLTPSRISACAGSRIADLTGMMPSPNSPRCAPWMR